MKKSLKKDSFYVDTRQYDITLTTSFLYKHGISGHVFEMIEYYWFIKQYTSLKPCILLADGTTIDEFESSLSNKYIDTHGIMDDVLYRPAPSLLLTKRMLIVDGSFRGLDRAEIFAEAVYIFRCKEEDFSYFNKKFKKVFLLQDFKVYDERYEDLENVNVIDYNKKILFSNLKGGSFEGKRAMFYLTSTCRAIPDEDVKQIAASHGFDDYIVITNTPDEYTNGVQIPLLDLWSQFSTYIYTPIPMKWDCSSRFIMECTYFGKDVIFNIDYEDRALNVRRNNTLAEVELTENDMFIQILQEHG